MYKVSQKQLTVFISLSCMNVPSYSKPTEKAWQRGMHTPVPESPVHPVLIQTAELTAAGLLDEAGGDM